MRAFGGRAEIGRLCVCAVASHLVSSFQPTLSQRPETRDRTTMMTSTTRQQQSKTAFLPNRKIPEMRARGRAFSSALVASIHLCRAHAPTKPPIPVHFWARAPRTPQRFPPEHSCTLASQHASLRARQTPRRSFVRARGNRAPPEDLCQLPARGGLCPRASRDRSHRCAHVPKSCGNAWSGLY